MVDVQSVVSPGQTPQFRGERQAAVTEMMLCAERNPHKKEWQELKGKHSNWSSSMFFEGVAG